MYELTIQEQIASAHFLEGYEGKCKNLHGHNWKIEVTVYARQLNDIGMVTDFGILKEKLAGLLKNIDHTCLNDVSFFKEQNPTTENIAHYIFEKFSETISPLGVKNVRVWESDTSSASYYEE